MKKLFSIFAALTLLISLLSSPAKVYADGVLIHPSYLPIYESGQTAAIFYQNGVEHLILSIEFYGKDLEEFGWIVPVPNEPTIEKGDSAIFDELADMTVKKETLLEKLMGNEDYYYAMDFGGALQSTDSAENKSTVEVIDEKQVGVLDVATIRAEKVQDLIDWMDENNYEFPSSENVSSYYETDDGNDEKGEVLQSSTLQTKQILQDYIDDGWYFILTKVDPEFVDSEIETNNYNEYYYSENEKVELTPLRISFPTTEIIYPMKISSIGMTSQSIKLYVFDDHKARVSNYDLEISANDDDSSRFEISYAEKIDKDLIDDLTSPIGKESWLEPEDDMYLTKLYCSSLSYTNMDQDVLFEDAENNRSVNAGEMNLWQWIVLPIVFVIYLPYNILTGFEGLFSTTNSEILAISGILLFVGLNFVLALTYFSLLRRTYKKFLRILLHVLLFPSVWLMCFCLSLLVGIPSAYIMSMVGIVEEAVLINFVMILGMTSTALTLLVYRLLMKVKRKEISK